MLNIFLLTILGTAQRPAELGPQPWPETWVDRTLPVSSGNTVSTTEMPRSNYGTGNTCEDLDNNRFFGGTVLYDRFTKRESTCLDNGREAFWTNILTSDLEDHFLCWSLCRGDDDIRRRPLTCEKWCSVVGTRIQFSWNFDRNIDASGTGAIPKAETDLQECQVNEIISALFASPDLGPVGGAPGELLTACPILAGVEGQTDDCVCAEAVDKYRNELERIPEMNCEFVSYGVPLLKFMESKLASKECEPENEWEVLKGFCRNSRGGSGRYKKLDNIDSARLCQLECKQNKLCVAAEYQPKNRVCELHWDPITTSNPRNAEGTECFVRKEFETLEGYCRTESGGSGTFTVIHKIRTARACQLECEERRGCVAAEYQPTRRVCELHSDPVTKSTGKEQDRTQCFRFAGTPSAGGGAIEKIITETEFTEIEVVINIRNGRTRTEIIRVPNTQILEARPNRRLAPTQRRLMNLL